MAEELALEQHLRRVGRRKRRDRPGLEAGRGPHLVMSRDAGVARARRSRNLQRIRASVTGQEREDGPPVADEDERLDDLSCLAANRYGCCCSRRRAVRELL